MKRLYSEAGQAMIEFALVLPLLITIFCGTIDIGWLFLNSYETQYAASKAADSAAYGADSRTPEELGALADSTARMNLGKDSGDSSVSVTVYVGEDSVCVCVENEIPSLTFVMYALRGSSYKLKSVCTAPMP